MWARRWFIIALTDLLIAAILGAVLRAVFVWELPFVHFRPWLHGHSHTALLGWLFIGLMVVFFHDGGTGTVKPAVRRLLAGMQLAVIAMCISFPLQGYGAVSIAASSVHMLLAYWSLRLLWKASTNWPSDGSRLFTRTAILMFVLSTLGIWAIAPIILTGNQGHEIYYWSVQFFLHFQFNGWFWFAAIALGIRWAERNGIDLRTDRLTYWLWVTSAIFTYALAIAWSEPHPLVFATVSVAVILQAWAAVRTLKILDRSKETARARFSSWVNTLVGIALVSMAMKVVTQTAVAIPSVAVVGLTLRHYVIGFIHLNTLAIMTCLLLAYALLQGWLDLARRGTRWGLICLISGIIGSELLLFLQGTFFWAGLGSIRGHYTHLFIVSALMPIGVAVILANNWRSIFDRE